MVRKREEKTTKRRKRLSIDKDVEVIIANNTYGKFVYASRMGDLSLGFEGHGDDEVVTFGELRKLKPFLQNMELIITEVNDDEVTIADVVNGLHIRKVYDDYFELVADVDDPKDVDQIDPYELEDVIEDGNVRDFEDLLRSSLRRSVILTAVAMYKEGRLSDRRKLKLIEETRPGDEHEQEYFWNDIEASLV